MAKYTYPAVFFKGDNGTYTVDFPDFKACYTSGDTQEEAETNAVSVLETTLTNMQKEGAEIPAPSLATNIFCGEDDIVKMISCDVK